MAPGIRTHGTGLHSGTPLARRAAPRGGLSALLVSVPIRKRRLAMRQRTEPVRLGGMLLRLVQLLKLMMGGRSTRVTCRREVMRLGLQVALGR